MAVSSAIASIRKDNVADPDKSKRLEDVVGTVVRGPLGTGSKSERVAVWLEADGRRWALRRKGGPSYGDHSFDKFIGKRVRCSGLTLDYTLLVERIELLD